MAGDPRVIQNELNSAIEENMLAQLSTFEKRKAMGGLTPQEQQELNDLSAQMKQYYFGKMMRKAKAGEELLPEESEFIQSSLSTLENAPGAKNVPLGELRYVLEVTKDPNLAQQIGNEVLKRANYPGQVVALDKFGGKGSGSYAITDQSGNAYAINPKGLDPSDLKATQGVAVNSLPLAGSVGGAFAGGPAGSGLGSIVGGLGAQTAREMVEQEYLPNRQNVQQQIGDVALAGGQEALYNLGGKYISKGIGAAGKATGVDKLAGKGIEALSKTAPAQAVGKGIEAVGNVAQALPGAAAFKGAAESIAKTRPGAEILGVEAPGLENKISEMLGRGLSESEIIKTLQKDTFGKKGNVKQAGELLTQNEGKFAQSVKDTIEKLGGGKDAVATGYKIREKAVNAWKKGLAEEREGYNAATEMAKKEAGSTFNLSDFDNFLAAKEGEEALGKGFRNTLFEGVDLSAASPSDLLKVGRRINNSISNPELSSSEFGVLSAAREKLVSGMDSVYQKARGSSPAIDSYLKSNAQRIQRNNIIDKNIYNSFIGSKADLPVDATTGMADRNLSSPDKVFKSTVGLWSSDPEKFAQLKDYLELGPDDLKQIFEVSAKDSYVKEASKAKPKMGQLAKQRELNQGLPRNIGGQQIVPDESFNSLQQTLADQDAIQQSIASGQKIKAGLEKGKDPSWQLPNYNLTKPLDLPGRLINDTRMVANSIAPDLSDVQGAVSPEVMNTLLRTMTNPSNPLESKSSGIENQTYQEPNVAMPQPQTYTLNPADVKFKNAQAPQPNNWLSTLMGSWSK